MIFSNVFYAFFAYSYKVYGENADPHEPINDRTLSWAVSTSAVVNGLSRIVIGAFVDKLGFKTIFTILMVI